MAFNVSAEHIKLFVITGQSNALGTTAGGEADATPGSDPADDAIKFFWHNVVDDSTSLGDSGGVFTTLQQQQGGHYAQNATHWGPEIGFARTLYRAGVRNFGVIKAARGGGGNTYWSKADGGHMYRLVVDTVNQAIANLTANGHTAEVIGFLYLQGESDSASEAAVAGSRLSALISNLRIDLPDASNMVAVAGGIAAAGATRDVVRAQQAALATGDATISYFDNVNLRGSLYDNLHFDKPAKLKVGQHYAYAFWQSGRVPLPASRRSSNRGEGTILNWTGQANQYKVERTGNQVPMPKATLRAGFETLIRDWRNHWQRDFPFYYVQLPGMGRPWELFREMQLECLEIPNTGMAVTIDIGDQLDVALPNTAG